MEKALNKRRLHGQGVFPKHKAVAEHHPIYTKPGVHMHRVLLCECIQHTMCGIV